MQTFHQRVIFWLVLLVIVLILAALSSLAQARAGSPHPALPVGEASEE